MSEENGIIALLKRGERVNLECKEGAGGLPKSMWETFSAFSNTDGGTILIGIRENRKEQDPNKRFTIAGVKNPHARMKEIWDHLHSDQVSSCSLREDDVKEVVCKGKSVIRIDVPRAPYQDRPVYLNKNILGMTFRRSFEGDYHCPEQEIKAMIRDARPTGNDSLFLEHYSMNDIDEEALGAYRNEFSVKNPDHVWNGYDNRTFLRQLGGWTMNRSTGEEALTLAGLLMFGKGLPIRECFPDLSMEYLDRTDLGPESRWSDRLTYDGTWENNLYNFLRRVMPKITHDLKRPFKMEGITRVDDTPIHKAIREAMVNLIIHADFLLPGKLQVEKYDDRFVFINPGSLLLPVERIFEGGTSRARNPKIQQMFRMIGYGESIGSGIPTILKAWKGENWREPDLKDEQDLQQVRLTLWMVSILPAEISTRLHEAYGQKYEELSSDEQIILCTAYQEEGVTNARLQSILKEHPADITKTLAGLTERGFLRHEAKGRWTIHHAVINPNAARISAGDHPGELGSGQDGPGLRASASAEKLEHPDVQVSKTIGNTDDEPEGRDTSQPQLEHPSVQVSKKLGTSCDMSKIDGGSVPHLEPGDVQVGSVIFTGVDTASAGASSIQVVDSFSGDIEKLLELLGDKARSMKELMALLGEKNRMTVKRRYLQPALKKGVITMTLPDKRNSPKQKYRRTDSDKGAMR